MNQFYAILGGIEIKKIIYRENHAWCGKHTGGRKTEMAKPLPALCLAERFCSVEKMILPEKHINESLCMESKSCSRVNLRKMSLRGKSEKIGSRDLRSTESCGKMLDPEEVGSQ